MDQVANNSIAGVKPLDSIFPNEVDFNRPVTRALYEASAKIKNVHVRRLIMALPGGLTAAIVDPLKRILWSPIALTQTVSAKFDEQNARMIALLDGTNARGLSDKQWKKAMDDLVKERRIMIVTLPVTYPLAMVCVVGMSVVVSVADVATSPVHTAWRVAKIH